MHIGAKMDPNHHHGAIVTTNLSIKGVSAQVAERLRARAERHHRSLQGELMAIVERAAAEDDPGLGAAQAAAPGPVVATSPAPVQRQGWRSIEDLVADQRERRLAAGHVPPPPGLPLAVDIIRAERDSR